MFCTRRPNADPCTCVNADNLHRQFKAWASRSAPRPSESCRPRTEWCGARAQPAAASHSSAAARTRRCCCTGAGSGRGCGHGCRAGACRAAAAGSGACRSGPLARGAGSGAHAAPGILLLHDRALHALRVSLASACAACGLRHLPQQLAALSAVVAACVRGPCAGADYFAQACACARLGARVVQRQALVRRGTAARVLHCTHACLPAGRC